MSLISKTASRYPLKTALFIRVKNSVILPLRMIDSETPKSGTICELGSGFGMVGIYLALSSGKRKITGYEISKSRVVIANKAAKGLDATFLQKDLTLDPITDHHDSYLLVDFLHHIPFRSQEKILRKISESQKKGDIILIKEIEKERGIRYSLNFLCDKMMTRLDTLRFRQSPEWKEILEDLGYTVICTKKGGIFPHILIKGKKQ